VPLGRNRARPRCTVRGAARGHAGHGPRPRGCGLRSLGQPRPTRPATARRSAAHVGAVTAPAHASRRGWRRRHNGGDGANGGGRAPTRVRLPAGHGGRNASSPELLVDGEEKKSDSAAASLRRGGATVAGGGPVTARREGRVRSTLHGRRTARGELGRRSPWSCSRWRRRPAAIWVTRLQATAVGACAIGAAARSGWRREGRGGEREALSDDERGRSAGRRCWDARRTVPIAA
jgi:hypothetical protein